MVRKVEMQHHMHGNFENPSNYSPSTMVSHRSTQRVSRLYEITFVGTNMAPGGVHHPGPTEFYTGGIQRSSCPAAHTRNVDWRMTQTIEGSLRQIMAECPTLTSAERTPTVRRKHNCPTADSTAKLLTWKRMRSERGVKFQLALNAIETGTITTSHLARNIWPGIATAESRISKRTLELPNYRAISRVDKRRQAVPKPQVAILVSKDIEESSNAAKRFPVMSNSTGNPLMMPWILRSKFLEAARTMLRDVAAPEPITKQRSCDYNRYLAFTVSPEHYSTFEPIGENERSRLKKLKTELQALIVKVGSGYKKYRGCLETLRNNFHARGGQDSALTYTSLSLQAISRNFRTMKDPVDGILRICSEALREDFSRDHPEKPNECRQRLHRRTVSPRRPAQRGQLPERAVAILRRWMFEHFLNPYPALEEKCFLARKTGLTRQKVSNWFINARVRLWKPMVEELYEDEFAPRSETDETDGPVEQQSDTRCGQRS
ncbi:uncharacterized protein [Physcomitrium patens]|uniref:Homeobox domain-containing protein n=2 Tax=Physcomitrium patens TaxID=3218 RepID=A0A2K1KQ58_PHYPA|nr:hypothetical protein PHYPA_006829 [Physcomitrium patens]